MSWKQFFCETELGFIIEKFPLDFEAAELDELKNIVQAVKQYIFCLKIRDMDCKYAWVWKNKKL